MPFLLTNAGTGTSVLTIPQSNIFTSTALRDTYFASNPDKLNEGVYAVVNNDLQQYRQGVWITLTTTIKGPPGEGGAPGDDGESPTIIENAANDVSTYKLDITDVNGTITTPNLKSSSNHATLANKDIANQHPIGAITGLGDVVYQSYLEWINGKFEFITPPPTFDESGLVRYPVSFIEGNETDNPVITVNSKDYPLFIADRPLLANRIAPQEQCFLWFRPNACYVSGLDPLRASIETGLEGVDKNEYMTPYVTRAIINKIVDKASNETYNAAVSYTDSVVKDYKTISLYLQTDGTMGTNKPTGTGTVVEKVLTTIEQLIYETSYVIPDDGVVLKDNLYILNLFFSSISTSRVTYIRAVYSVGNTVIFDSLSALNNTIGEYELYRQIINQLIVDTPYNAGSTSKLEIYGRVDSGNDRIELYVGDVAKPSGLFRNAPIATLSASKITTIASGTSQSQEAFNKQTLNIIQALEARIQVLEVK